MANTTAELAGTFSYAPGYAPMIAVTPAEDSEKAIAMSRLVADARPLDALATMGQRFAHPTQSYSLGGTLARTSFARRCVVPA